MAEASSFKIRRVSPKTSYRSTTSTTTWQASFVNSTCTDSTRLHRLITADWSSTRTRWSSRIPTFSKDIRTCSNISKGKLQQPRMVKMRNNNRKQATAPSVVSSARWRTWIVVRKPSITASATWSRRMKHYGEKLLFWDKSILNNSRLLTSEFALHYCIIKKVQWHFNSFLCFLKVDSVPRDYRPTSEIRSRFENWKTSWTAHDKRSTSVENETKQCWTDHKWTHWRTFQWCRVRFGGCACVSNIFIIITYHLFKLMNWQHIIETYH